MKNSLFDSSALLAVIKKEQGYEEIENYLSSSFISSVNYCEVISVLTLAKVPVSDAKDIIKPLIYKIIPLDEQIASRAGEMITITNEHGLSLGDRVCIATGEYYDYEIITTDRAWSKIKLPVKISIMR